MIRLLPFLLAGIFITRPSKAQIHSQLYTDKQEMFLEAESYQLFEEFNEALPLYLELLKDQPGNSFLNYRIGTCYLNIHGEKETAIEYLEKAIENLDSRDRRPTFRTTKAPLDALFYLANAYHINYQFDKALEMYKRFRESLDPSTYNTDIVDEHIQASLNAIKSTEAPVFFLEENLGERINTRFSETNPVVSGDRKIFVFTRKMQFYDGVFFSQKDESGNWSWPMEITAQLGSDGDCYPVSLSYDGKELYLYKSDDLVGNIYTSHFVDGQWTPMKNLNDNINTRYWESHASISKDGNTLYFTSNRPGGFGGLDIYYSQRESSGDWGRAVNMGPVINTPFNEETPFVTENGRTVYFSSYGHYNIGGYDVFYSTLNDKGEWSAPLNAGYGISTPDDDLFFYPVNGAIYAYVSRFDDNGFGGTDIYRYEIFSDSHPRKFLVKGVMERQNGLQTGIKAMISVVDPHTGEARYSVKPHQVTGEYEVWVEAGDWELIFSEKGHEDLVRPLKLPLMREDTDITVDAIVNRPEPEIPGIEEIITDRIILPEETTPLHTPGIEQYQITLNEDVDASYHPIIEDGLPNETAYRENPDYRINQFGLEYESPEELIHELLPYVSGEMVLFLNKLLDEEKVPGTTVELIELIIKCAESNGYDKGELAEAFTNKATDHARAIEYSHATEEDGKDPAAEEEDAKDPAAGRKIPLWWILLLAILLLAAFYFKERSARGRNKP